MVSNIDSTKPLDGVPAAKADLRANLAAAKAEISALQAQTSSIESTMPVRIIHKAFAYDYASDTIIVRDGSVDGFHRHFGGITEGADGRLHLFYRRAPEHALTSGQTIYHTTSDDGGLTWSSEVTLIPAVAGLDHRAASVGTTPTGRIIVIYGDVPAPASAPTVMSFVYSDDGGVTWTQGTPIASIPFSFARAYGRIKLIPGNAASKYRLAWTPYYQSGSGPSTYRAAVWTSQDDGLTWTEGAPITDTTAGDSEAEMVAINALVWFAVTRGGSGLTLWKTVNSGATWSSVGVVPLTSTDSQVAPTLDKFYRDGRWYILLGYCDRNADDARFRIAPVADALISSAAFGGAIIGATDMVNASGYQSTVTKPDGTIYLDGGMGYVEFKEYVGFTYSQVRFVRKELFQAAYETPRALLVSGGTLTVFSNAFETNIQVDTEAAASTDDLDTINGGYEGQVLTFRSSTSSRDVIFKSGTGNLELRGDFRLNTSGAGGSKIVLMKSGTDWVELARTPDHTTTAPALTVVSDAVTVPSYLGAVALTVGTEGGGATDDLSTINGGLEGQIIILSSSSSSQDTTLKDGVDNLNLAGDFTLSNTADNITLFKKGSTWYEVSRSDNA